MIRLAIAVTAAAALLASCGGSHAGHDMNMGSRGMSGHDMGSGDGGSVPGEAASAADATEKVDVATLDELRFDPASIDVDKGEVVTFAVHNPGKTDHEFVLGDDAYQKSHEAEMQGSEHMMDSDNAVTIGPGETQKLTWKFTEAGEVMYACHEPGHYDGGMVGTIEVR